jgi:hypothetical protein
MSRFIRLTNMLLNINDIHKIVINANKYDIHITTRDITGNSWNISAFGIGTISTYHYKIEVCETKDPADYKILSEWIDKYQ